MFNINFANDWIRTADLWSWKQPLYQLSHNHFPSCLCRTVFWIIQFLLFLALKLFPSVGVKLGSRLILFGNSATLVLRV